MASQLLTIDQIEAAPTDTANLDDTGARVPFAQANRVIKEAMVILPLQGPERDLEYFVLGSLGDALGTCLDPSTSRSRVARHAAQKVCTHENGGFPIPYLNLSLLAIRHRYYYQLHAVTPAHDDFLVGLGVPGDRGSIEHDDLGVTARS